MMCESLPVAAIQLNSQQDIEANLSIIQNAVANASHQGAKLVVLPENACSMGRQQETAERFDELSEILAVMAHRHQVYLLAGTLPCRYRPDGSIVPKGLLRQVSQLFAPDGSRVARYDKIHLFTATVDDSHGNYNEAKTFEAGAQTVVAPMVINQDVFHIGMMVCFDIRFPVLAQRLRQMGADILTVPSAFTYLTGQAHWSLLLRARALDSQCLVIGASQGGVHQYQDGRNQRQKRQTWGHAGIAQADGTLLSYFEGSDLENDKKYEVVLSHFDKALQKQLRERLPIDLCHRLA